MRGLKTHSSPSVQNRDPVTHLDETTLRWQKLLEYYSACVSAENAGEVTLYSFKEGTNFVQVPKQVRMEWIISGRERLEIQNTNAHSEDFFRTPRWARSPISYFYGFPCHVKYIKQSKRGWSGHVIQPILIFAVDSVRTDEDYAFVLQSDRPKINSAFLTDASLLTSVEERKHIAEVLLDSWDENSNRHQNMCTILSTLAEILPQEVPFSKQIVEGELTNLDQITNVPNGIHSIAILFKTSESPYTAGLEQELNGLRGTVGTNHVWRLILERNSQINQHKDGEQLVEITALNDEQRSVIESAFSNILTVVTGPPGTGKSQVVLNIVANALSHGQTVLFGSKNHKAVDVVIERLLRLQSEPVILKYGQRQREAEFAESLLSAAERATAYDSKALNLEIQRHEKEINEARSQEKTAHETLLRILERRNRISHLDATLDQIKRQLPPLTANNLEPYRLLTCSTRFLTLLRSLENLIKQSESRPTLFSRILGVFGRSVEKRITKVAEQLLNVLPVEQTNLTLESLHNCKELMVVAQLLKRLSETQNELLNLVKLNEAEPPIEVLRERIAKSKEQAINISTTYVDALMRKRLMTLGRVDRKEIVDYVHLVRRLEADMTGGDIAEELRKESKRMFKSVVKAFPAIAVTNLSVRRALPLNPEIVDIAVIDEASQCDIASALPLLYRAKRAVVIGDPNQLRHISMLHRADDQQLQKEIGLTSSDDQRFLYSLSSLFDLARTVVGTGAKFVNLLEHYRSRTEIIGFSNKKFYGNQLTIWTNYRKLKGFVTEDAVIWHNIVGEVTRPSQGSAYNLQEAEAVVQLIKKITDTILAQPQGPVPSLGVVTPFREQANKIRDLVEQKIDPSLLRELDFIVDTAHKYQGDERDIMIFSPVVSKKTPERSLGFLASTVNLFNVSITRARTQLHIVGDRAACLECGISHLSDFVRYVDQLQPQITRQLSSNFESPWEEILFEALRQEGIRAIPQYPIHQYRLDLAILDSEIPIDIEVDGELWHRDIDGGRLLSDLKRDQHLTILGWRVKRLWVYQLRNNLTQCVQEIKASITSK
jgi:very-short-patch-repair endonuclease/RecA/RadA recombinase